MDKGAGSTRQASGYKMKETIANKWSRKKKTNSEALNAVLLMVLRQLFTENQSFQHEKNTQMANKLLVWGRRRHETSRQFFPELHRRKSSHPYTHTQCHAHVCRLWETCGRLALAPMTGNGTCNFFLAERAPLCHCGICWLFTYIAGHLNTLIRRIKYTFN